MDRFSETAAICKVLSVDTRLRMLELLKSRSLCVNALAKNLGITPAAVSQHLRILRDLGAVVPEKRGYFVHYRLSEETLKDWSGRIQEVLRPSPEREDFSSPPNSSKKERGEE